MAEENSPFESPRLLIAGARRHIAAFTEGVEELKETNWTAPQDPRDPTKAEPDIHPQFKIPPEMKTIVFDVMNNLRSALDHAVYASTHILTGYDGDGGTKFPFGDTAKEARGDTKKGCRHVPPEMVEFLLSLEPHRDGNPILYGLNKLRNTKSHKVLVPVAASVEHVTTQPVLGMQDEVLEWNPATRRMEAVWKPSPNFRKNMVIYAFRLVLVIGTGTFKGEPALSVLDRMLSEVERVVSAIEAETACLLRQRTES